MAGVRLLASQMNSIPFSSPLLYMSKTVETLQIFFFGGVQRPPLCYNRRKSFYEKSQQGAVI
jgi:hypothetical protein